ncbi:class I SAM-dependent methyltransferase [Streptomyces sp. NPDC048506]|uniref:class I SAM-dependent methyltransferase n=1 Tax=Streptomyces sp. NPDC048506 TaxID=3155028 RepID=UPI0034130DB9
MTDIAGTTRETYDAIAPAYARRWRSTPPPVTAAADRLAGLLAPGARIADVGCGPGHQTRLLRDRGFRVTGFDLSREMLAADAVPGLVQADMRALPLAASAVDAVWCVAALLHVPRPEVPAVLDEFARVVRRDGLLALSLAEGDDEGWEPVSYAPELRRWYVGHRLAPLTALLAGAGFEVTGHTRWTTHRDWLMLHARRR